MSLLLTGLLVFVVGALIGFYWYNWYSAAKKIKDDQEKASAERDARFLLRISDLEQKRLY